MTLKEFIFKTHTGNIYNVRPFIVCKDGFKMSVQASEGHYCSPRSNEPYYSEMEIGFPSEKEDSILKYADSKEHPTNTVYGYVPVDIIQDIIDKHKGIDLDKTFKNK